MIAHIIIRNNDDIFTMCKQFAYNLCKEFNGELVCRVITEEYIHILSESSSDINIYVQVDSNNDDKAVSINIEDLSTYDSFDSIINIIQSKWVDTCWGKNEIGWWYKIPKESLGGHYNKVFRVNNKWYCIGADYYMKTGWQPVIDNDEPNVLYFDTVSGELILDKDKSMAPDISDFDYAPMLVKWW